MDGLLERFGEKTDSQYDLNADGIVNVLDLIQFLMEGGGSPIPAPVAEEAEPASVTSAAEATPLPTPELTTQPSADGASGPVAVQPEEEQEIQVPLTLQGLLKSWGQADSPYDLNTDGIVNVLDLIEFLMDHPGPDGSGPDHDVPQDSLAAGTRSNVPATLAQERQRLGQVADSLVGGLVKAGFDEHPPAGIHDMVDALKLTGRQKQHLMSHLDAHYHNGLGVNLVG
ncbi:MAG: hypothetical protein ACYSXF_10645 [Planctomycetota bacterium]